MDDKAGTTKPPRSLTPEEEANIKGLDEFMGRPGRVVWYVAEDGKWRPGWEPIGDQNEQS